MKIKFKLVLLSFLLLANSCKNTGNLNAKKNDQPVLVDTTKESFVQIEQKIIDQLNEKIQVNIISSVNDVANLYHPKLTETEGNYTYNISSQPINDSTTELTLKETGIMDDSIKGIQTVFSIVNAEKKFVIKSMKENYQCYRGHQNWSAEKCY
jgi:tRNA U38,U39,U40 pseudouridine synthase TruA